MRVRRPNVFDEADKTDKWSKCLMEAKKIKEEAAANVASEAMEQDENVAFDGIEKQLELMEGGRKTAVNGPLIPLRRYSTVKQYHCAPLGLIVLRINV